MYTYKGKRKFSGPKKKNAVARRSQGEPFLEARKITFPTKYIHYFLSYTTEIIENNYISTAVSTFVAGYSFFTLQLVLLLDEETMIYVHEAKITNNLVNTGKTQQCARN